GMRDSGSIRPASMLRRTDAWISEALMPSSFDTSAYGRFLRSTRSLSNTTTSKDLATMFVLYSRIANSYPREPQNPDLNCACPAPYYRFESWRCSATRRLPHKTRYPAVLLP